MVIYNEKLLEGSMTYMKRQIKMILKRCILITIIFISFTSISNTEEIFENPQNIKITVISEWKPFSYLDLEGNPKGILIDFWKAWGRANNVEVEFNTQHLGQNH